MDKSVLQDPACEECDKMVEVLTSSEQQEPHQVTIRVGTSPWLPRVYLKEGQERKDKIYSGGKVEEYWSSYSSSYYNYYDYFWNEILEKAGANVFIRNSGDVNANIILKFSHFNVYSPKAVNAWVYCVFHNAFIGGVCSGSTANGRNQCLDSLSKYSSTMMCPGFNVIFLIINGPVTLFCFLCFQQID